MIALRGIVEKSSDGRNYSWKGRWAFGSDVPAASPSALPFEYVWESPVDPASISVPSVELQNEPFEEEVEGQLAALVDSQEEISSQLAKQSADATEVLNERDNIADDKAAEATVKQTPVMKNDEKSATVDAKMTNETNEPAKSATATQSDFTTQPFQEKPAANETLMETPRVKKTRKVFTFADPVNPGDPAFTDASSIHDGCPPSGSWKGFFETLPRKSNQPNVPIHEQCYLFLNATPPADALVQFWDESQPPNETAKFKLPVGHVLVRGMGTNQYGTFELIGSYHLQTHLLTCQRIYVAVPPSPKNSGHRKRPSSGGGVGGPADDHGSGRPYRTRNKQSFSWKQRLDESSGTQAPATSSSSRRKRSRSEGTFGLGKRLKIAIPDHAGEGSMTGTSLLTPASAGSEAAGGSNRPSPRGMSVHVARKSNAAVGNGTIKLPNAGEPSKAHWRAAHFLYYHRDAPAATASAASALTGGLVDMEAGSDAPTKPSTSASANAAPKAVVYEGEMYHGQRDGRGICLFNNGLLYEGTWRRNKEHGMGILMTADRKRVIYRGEWDKGRMNGRGVYFYGTDRRVKKDQKPGARYEGEFKENLKHGTGIYYFADGSVYDGSWRDGMMAGRGIFTWPDESVYEGEWKDSKRHGQGILKASDGFFYDGNWIANAMEGRGTAVYPNGQKYIGLFVCGRREGRGTMLFTNGATYEGRFRDDAIDGQGTLRLSRAMAVPRETEDGEDESAVSSKPDFMIPVSFQSDMGHIHRTAGFTLGGE
ncbi:hypothetical protein MPSEU_000095000 [Mayamaea pseudoterrestris]|nr:hypothetical protein MPSEU_000095000 [Mayamaea pseudoterrestris]